MADELAAMLREQPYQLRCLLARSRRLAADLPTVWEPSNVANWTLNRSGSLIGLPGGNAPPSGEASLRACCVTPRIFHRITCRSCGLFVIPRHDAMLAASTDNFSNI